MAIKFNRIWSDAELEAALDAYIEMLGSEREGRPFNKAEINRSLREPGSPLEGRTKASIEYRMQNISAVLKEADLPIVKGYAPAANVGNGTSSRIWTIWQQRQGKN